ncbi:hypothetical protein KKB28_07335, partial [bacterium]|nr:hypothetical protein [bacterium]
MRRIHGLLILSFLVFTLLGYAAEPPKLRILGISIEGNQTTDAGLIRAYSGLAVGKEVSGDDIQGAVRQLWRLDLFSDIQILEDREVAEGIYLIIHVEEYPRLEEVQISGNRKLKGDDLDAAIGLTPGQVLHPRDVVRLKNRLKEKYASKGYLLAKVETETYESTSTGRQVVNVMITEGKKVKIRRINFEGNEAFSDKTLRKRFKKTRKKTFFRSGEFNEEKFSEDLKLLGEFYREEGYRDFEVVSDTISYTPNLRRMIVTVTVKEGLVYHYGKITWSGQELFSQSALEENLLVSRGDRYNEKKFKQGLQEIGAKYYDRG